MTARRGETPEQKRERLDRKNANQRARRAEQGRAPRNEDLAAARRALSQHLHRHHNGAHAGGTLDQRIEEHDDLHFQMNRLGRAVGHEHEPLGDEESFYELAHRYLAEGTEQHGAADTTEDAGRTGTVDSGARVRRR